MLKIFYDAMGFGVSLLCAFLLFLLFIFWLAGLSGILIAQKERNEKKSWQTLLAILFFPYPILWMVGQMIRQRRLISFGPNSSQTQS
jgi:ABC-type polysaccharide/polyol phosphate export permease